MNKNLENEIKVAKETLKNYAIYEQNTIKDFNNYKEAIKKAAK